MASDSTIARTLEVLEQVHERTAQLREELRNKPPGQIEAAATFGAALAAVANLSPENITRLTDAVRRGQLPRKRSA